MSVVGRDNRRNVLSAMLIIMLSVIACNQPIPTTLPTAVVILTAIRTTLTPTPDNTPERTAVVSRPVVNVRETSNGKVIGFLRAGESVEIVECKNNWCQISSPIAGFVFLGCLDIESDLGCTAK